MITNKEKALQEYRKMWEWIARESKEHKRKVSKQEYTESHHLSLLFDCWLCEYVQDVPKRCDKCPILFVEERTNKYLNFCEQKDSLYKQWHELGDKAWKKASDLAFAIAQLPEREISEEILPDKSLNKEAIRVTETAEACDSEELLEMEKEVKNDVSEFKVE